MGDKGLRKLLPSPNMESAYFTPASVSTAAGDLLRGGPGSEFLASKAAGAPRLAVRITGILASASSLAT